MLCGRCNHDNPESNNYCGMCGFRLEKPVAKPPEPTAPKAGLERVPQPVEAPLATASTRQTSPGASILGLDARPQPSRPSITGPSFLGLNSDPAPDADYLLEDDESSHAGLWIALVLLIAVSVVGWRFGAQAAPVARQLYGAVVARVNPQPAAPAAAAAPTTDPAPPPVASAAQPSAGAPAKDASQPSTSPSPDAGAQTANSADPPDKPAGEALTAKEAPPGPAKPSPEVKEDPAPSAKAAVAKPARASRVKPADATAPQNDAVLRLAQKYIHGQGVRQDCVTGMAYLKQAMQHPSAPADSQMGALYATGTCVPLDRLAAYRYFTSALQLAPSDPWLGMERDKLYGQMTGAERHQADRQ